MGQELRAGISFWELALYRRLQTPMPSTHTPSLSPRRGSIRRLAASFCWEAWIRAFAGMTREGNSGAASRMLLSDLTFDHHFFDFCNGLGRVQAFGAGLRAVHNGVATV